MFICLSLIGCVSVIHFCTPGTPLNINFISHTVFPIHSLWICQLKAWHTVLSTQRNIITATNLFTSKKGPAELSLHSLIICRRLHSSGQRWGSLDSNGSMTYTHTHTERDAYAVKSRHNININRTIMESSYSSPSPWMDFNWNGPLEEAELIKSTK